MHTADTSNSSKSTDDEPESLARFPSRFDEREDSPPILPRKGRPPSMSQAKRAFMLRYFEPAGIELHRCLQCGKQLKTSKGSITALRTHVAMHKKKGSFGHPEEVKAWIVGTMVTCLNYPVSSLDHPMHKVIFSLMRLGSINAKIARRCTDREAERAIIILRRSLRELRDNGTVFALTGDEWSWQQKRFLGVTLHASTPIPCLDKKFFPLLARFRTKGTAENLLRILRTCLERLGLTIQDISGITTDGAPVMKRLGRELRALVWPRPFFHQLCLAHALHLAVVDTYGGKRWPEESVPQVPEDDDESDGLEPEVAGWRLVAMPDENNPGEREELLEAEEEFAGLPIIHGNPGAVVAKVRNVCRTFHTSAALSEQLLAQTSSAEGRTPSKCVLDVKTRWFSTLRMLRSFIALMNSMKSVFASVKKSWPLTLEDVETVQDLISTLKIVERASKRLSLQDVTMRNADIALEVMLRDLQQKRTVFAIALHRNICFRLLQRRGVVARLARYLQRTDETTPLDAYLEEVRGSFTEAEQNTFCQSGDISSTIVTFLRHDAERPRQSEPLQNADSSSEDDFELLKDRDEDGCGLGAPPPNCEALMKMHNQGAQRVFPEIMYKIFETLQATSVPSERFFSVARHSRRFSQEKMSDERFENHLLLKHFYVADKPWQRFLEGIID